MRALTLRIVRIFMVALLAYIAIAWSSARGERWLGWVLAGGLFVALSIFMLVRQARRARSSREARWEHAIYRSDTRPRAIGELKAALKKLEPVRASTRTQHAKFSVLLAELLDAEGSYAEAMAAVDRLSLEALPRLDAALVRHTRAVTHLRGGDARGALSAVSDRTPSGDAELDQRLGLLEAYAQIELGEAQRGLAHAEAVAHAQSTDPSVLTEASVVRAAGLDAQGRREEALVVLASLGRETLTPLAELGHPRVRELAKVVLDGVSV